MDQKRLGNIEEKFAEIIWANAPISSGELVKITAREFGWKKSTMYTVLRRFAEKGVFVNEDGIVRPLISREEFKTIQAEQIVANQFDRSLPLFITAFTSRNTLTEEEIRQIREIIDSCGTDPSQK
jgi:predicted transcriptional regulator